MNASELSALAPYGATVRATDGAPMPPARFKNKVRDWQGRNFTGRFVAVDAKREGFTLQTLDSPVLVINRTLGTDCRLSFEVTPPAPGTILACSKYADSIEAAHVWESIDAARAWAESRRYNLATCGYFYKRVAADGSLEDFAPEDLA